MLSKNEIIKELRNEDFIVRNAVYEYVCNLHLYDDNEINEALIDFIQNNYKEINFVGLRFSKINQKIIEFLINIHLKEDDEEIKERINDVLVNHYSIIKNLPYNFEEIITDEINSLLYKKIKHFSKKDAEQLIRLYMNNVRDYYFSDEETDTTEILRNAIGTALIQTEEGYTALSIYAIELMMNTDEEYGDIVDFLNDHMPYLVHPLCQKASHDSYAMILGLYFQNIDFMDYADECNYYFSTICDDEFVEFYMNSLNDIQKNEKEEYDYDIAEYLNSEKIDKFLIEEMKKSKDKTIKENIMCILARKFDKEALPYILQYIQEGKAEDEYAIKDAIYPLLILENYDDDFSKEIISEVQDYNTFD